MQLSTHGLRPVLNESQRADSARLVLASASPRRHELLTSLGAAFAVLATDAEESSAAVPPPVTAALPPLALPLDDHPTLRAWRKAHAVAEQRQADVVLGADTIVVLDKHVLNKPRDADHARAMLMQLAGRTHIVYTGLCVLRTAEQVTTPAPDVPPPSFTLPPFDVWFELVASEVRIAPLSADDIAAYVATGEPLDKAGSYGIQGLGGQLVRQVIGSYTAVVGLPLVSTYRLLNAAGIVGLHNPAAAYHHWLSNQGKEPLPCPPTLP